MPPQRVCLPTQTRGDNGHVHISIHVLAGGAARILTEVQRQVQLGENPFSVPDELEDQPSLESLPRVASSLGNGDPPPPTFLYVVCRGLPSSFPQMCLRP